jgi:hypothetical protein
MFLEQGPIPRLAKYELVRYISSWRTNQTSSATKASPLAETGTAIRPPLFTTSAKFRHKN